MTGAQKSEIMRLAEAYARVHEDGLMLGNPAGPLLRAACHEAGAADVLSWASKRITQQNKEVYGSIIGACMTALMVGGVGSINEDEPT
jgi:hypothetical protein